MPGRATPVVGPAWVARRQSGRKRGLACRRAAGRGPERGLAQAPNDVVSGQGVERRLRGPRAAQARLDSVVGSNRCRLPIRQTRRRDPGFRSGRSLWSSSGQRSRSEQRCWRFRPSPSRLAVRWHLRPNARHAHRSTGFGACSWASLQQPRCLGSWSVGEVWSSCSPMASAGQHDVIGGQGVERPLCELTRVVGEPMLHL